MHSLKDLILFNIARFNRIRRKHLLEILTFMIKRSKHFLVHLRDRVRMIFGEIRLSDKQFFNRLDLKDPNLITVKKALDRRDLERAKTKIVTHMRIREHPSFFSHRKEKQKIMAALEKYFPQSKRITIQLAEKFVNHEFYFLGQNVDFKGDIDWHSTLVNNRRWPLSFSPNIDYFSSKRVGDIKLAWELNRTQHFVILGKAYWFSEDEKYAIEFTDQLLSWIEENPYKLGINWMEGIEAAIRIISWVWAYYFFLDSKYFNEKGHFEFLKCLYVHTKFIEEHLSDKWQINNNHLMAEAAGLALMGVMFPEFKEAERWKKKGIALLERELNTQILRDGVTWEQSTGYHKFVTDLCLLVVILMVKNGMKIPEAVLLKLSQMIDFLNYITKNDGRIPLVGDEDQGRVTRIDETAYDDARSAITIGSIIFNRKDWLRIKSEEAFWLLGRKALTKESKPVVQTSRLFKISGFLVMRDKDKYLLFLAGPQNPKYLHASHKHLDMLSFILDAYGTYFLVDPGTYTYFGDFKWRKYFKSIKAHNTVVVDDKDPVDIKEVFELSPVPFARIIDYATDNKFDWIEAKHNGYLPVSYVRGIFFVKPEYWVIIDLLEGSGEHTYDLYFHFNHELEIQFDEKDQSAVATGLMGGVKVSPLVTSLKGEILEGEFSPRYGIKFKAPILRYKKRGRTPKIFVTVLYPYKNGSIGEELAKSIKVSQIDVFGKRRKRYKRSEVTGIKIDFGACVDYIIYSHVGKKYISFADVKEVGKIAYFRAWRMHACNRAIY